MPKGYVKKQFGRAKKAIYKRYHTKTGNLNMVQMGKDIMWLKNAINSEKKQKLISSFGMTAANVANGHFVQPIQGAAQSLAENGRVGNQYKLTSIECQLDVINGPNQVTSDNTVHIYFFQIIGDKLEGTEGQGGTIANRLFDDNQSGRIASNSFRNQESYSQCRILNYKKVYFKNTDNTLTSGQGARAQREMKFFLNLKNGSPYQHFEKDAPSSTTVDKNKIYVLVLSDQGTALPSDPGVTVNLSYRINYVDN